MPRLLLKFLLLITLALTTTSLAARLLGSIQAPNPALRGFAEGCEEKPQFCWYGVVPGETLLEDGIQILNQKGYETNKIVEVSLDNGSKAT